MTKNILASFCIFAMLSNSVSALAQDATEQQLRGIYEKAEVSYGIGRLEEARNALSDNLKSFSGSLRQSVFRLLALCSLGLDNEADAEEYARLLLEENPYYSPTLNDPQRFIDMVERISGRSEGTITTASSHEEQMNEVPVPTTLITEQMIRDSGARNLQEVLAAYVPGMSIVDCNDDINIAMRGIFSSGQENILIMLDGHRINSYSTNTAAPDFSISLDKLRQIEVLRGPASSLYGGVALTAVVNLITKKGGSVDGVKMRAGMGTHGQMKGSVIFGKRYYDLDLLVWGSVYKAKGEERDAEGSLMAANHKDKIIVGGIGKNPSYDLGMTLGWKDFQLMFDLHHSEVRSPYTKLAVPYDYDRYRTYQGRHPGFSTTAHHAELKYSSQIGKVSFGASVFLDRHDMTRYQVISDDTLEVFGETLGLSETISALFRGNGGTSRIINGLETDLGAQIRGDYKYYDGGQNHSGYLTFGAEYSHFTLDDVRYTMGYDFASTTPENRLISEMGKGSESYYNGFVQLKHRWKSFIMNAGLRYDHKVRYDYSRVNELSPRLAVIFVKPKWNAKLSYSRSFVDAPYLYQKIDQFLPLLGAQDVPDGDSPKGVSKQLSPETMHSVQLTFAGTKWLPGLDFELNFFHNRAYDLILTEILSHVNSGMSKIIGTELMASYRRGRLTANLNATWIKTLESNIIYNDIGDNNCTPAFASNLVLAWQATKHLRLSTRAIFQSRQTSYNLSYLAYDQLIKLFAQKSAAEAEGNVEEVERLTPIIDDFVENRVLSKLAMAPRFVMDIGAEYTLGKATLRLDIHNLLNRKYNQSGTDTGLVPQRSRWFLATLGLDI